jgi:two-component system sensor histidine kinase BaeS
MEPPQFAGRFLRLGITARLFLAVLAVCAIMIVGMSAATRWSFQQGFAEYLEEIEADRVKSLIFELAEDYQQDGNWDSLKQPRNWRRMIFRFTRAQEDRNPSPAKGQAPPAAKPADRKTTKNPPSPGDSPPSPAERARRAWETAHLRARLGLLAQDRTTLIAGVRPSPRAAWLPIVSRNATVGWLTREPMADITDSIDLRFQERQRTATLAIALLALVLAALAAMLMARGFISPLRRLAETVDRLADGDFSARVQPAARRFFPALGRFFPSRETPAPSGETGPIPAFQRHADELQALAGQINHLAGVLESNEKARRAFMAEVSHDLRTPLAVLRGEIEALEDGVRQVTPESLTSLRAEVELLGRLVDDIHTLSLADTGALRFSGRRLDLESCLRAAAHTVQDRMAARDMRLDFPPLEEPIAVWADEARLGQVFRNILENSLRYTDPGGSVTIACHVDGAMAQVDIFDSAPAVPEEQLPLIFERFHTGDAARSRSRSGSGLGLAICRTLLAAQGGDIRALPSPLGGLWLRLHIPLGDTRP